MGTLLTFKNRLNNLTSKNKSLLLTKLNKTLFFDFHKLNFLEGLSSLVLLEKLFVQNKKTNICPILDPRDENSNEISKTLNQLYKTQNLLIEERGNSNLFLGYPLITGKLNDGTVINAPLLFLGVQLNKKTQNWQLQPKENSVFLNPSFLLAYSHFQEINIDNSFIETSFEEFPKEMLPFKTALYEFLKESPLNLNFNKELFTDSLQHYQETTKKDLESTEKNGELKLFPRAVLGVFPQSGSFLSQDYEYLEKLEKPTELETLFESKAKRVAFIKEENLLLPFRADASQEQAIKKIKEGNSMVIEGPPGTGKSQLICNLVADYATAGKKVLVVCQKKAALDTVYNRLVSKNLEPFVAKIHDIKKDRKEFYTQLSNQIESISQYKNDNQTADAILLDRDYLAISRKTEKIVTELNDLKEVLYDSSKIGKSIKELYLSLTKKPNVLAQVSFLNFKAKDIENYIAKNKSLNFYFSKQNKNGVNFWENNPAFKANNAPDKESLLTALNNLKSLKDSIDKKLSPYNLNSSILEFLMKQDFKSLKLVKKNIFIPYLSGTNYRTSPEKRLINKRLKQCVDTATHILKNFNKELYLPTKTQDLTALENNLEVLKKLDKAPYFGNEFLFKTFNNKYLNNFLAKYSVANKPRVLIDRIEHTLDILNSTKLFGERIDFTAVQDSLEEILIEVEERKDSNLMHKVFVKSYLSTPYKKLNNEEFIDFIGTLIDIKKDTQAFLISNQNLLSSTQVFAFKAEHFKDYKQLDLDGFLEILAIKESFTKEETELNKQIKNGTTEAQILEAYNLFWISELENEFPILRAVSSGKIELLEKELQKLVIKKEQISLEIILQKLKENTYSTEETNRLGKRTTYRDLEHQVGKKRLIWPIRKVVNTYFDEVFNLSPIFLASPETVSSLFDMSNTPFDLLIFDEASQCFAEEGIPAIFRAKQVVIAGDSKQLQPFDLYKVNYEDTDQENPDTEVTSLLALGKRYLEDYQLKGHYRSQRPELIAFSNQEFYKNSLQLLPDFNLLRKTSSAIEYHKVSGIWEDNENLEEAKKVIDLIYEIPKSKTIGIVCFNFKQCRLISSMLEHTDRKIQVKNIENIQGDEFDVVLFSIGYAPNRIGKLNMNFGSLNLIGGENRLNVAISRAKEKIMVVASILPNQLQTETSKNKGPKLLKAYLQFAQDCSKNLFKPSPFTSKKSYGLTLKERVLNTKLQNLNLKYKEELPFADITVTNLNRYQSLILTDDALYYEQSGAKETHAQLPLLLQQKGWSFKRIWSRNLDY